MNPKIIFKGKLNELSKEKFYSLINVPADSSEALIYFHCLWGNQKHFHRETLKGLNKTCSDTKTKTFFSIIWHAPFPGYKPNWDAADEKGKKLKKVFEWITELYPQKTNVLCHSMGNRVFQGVMQEMNKDSLKKKCIKEIVFAAGDVNADVFTDDYKNLSQMAQRIHIYKHSNDRLLKFSKFRLHEKRLGLNGPENADSLLKLHKNIFLIDVTETSSWRRPEPSNHVYFYWNPAVRKNLNDIFLHKESLSEDKKQTIYLYY
ncbi:MAG: alpha/beta hydrolase [Bacteroidia bacterium]|nr:alpha/beta hydrolase [Bacteroidia bacterium]